jgi:hypothetical protein
MKINIRKGLFRFWLVASIIWIAGIAVIGRTDQTFFTYIHFRMIPEVPAFLADKGCNVSDRN